MSELKRDTQMTLISRIPVMLFNFTWVILLTRLLGPEGNGIYTFLTAVLNLFITVIGFQLSSSLTFFLSKTPDEKEKIFSSVGVFTFLSINLFAILLTILVFVAPQVSKYFIPQGQPIVFFFCFLIISFILRSVNSLILSALRGVFRFRLYNLLSIVAQVIPVFIYGSLFFLTLDHTETIPLPTYFKIILLSETISMLIGIIILYLTRSISFSSDYKSYQKNIFQYSSRSLVISLGSFLNKRLDVWFVQHLKGTLMLGYYGLATQITNFVTEIMTPFNQVLLPYLAGTNAAQHKKMVGRIARLNFTIAFVAAILIISTARFFIPFVFGNQFSNAIPATQILSIGVIFISMRFVFNNYFKGINQFRYPIYASWMGVIVTILLDILLIPTYGIVGAALATITAYGLSSVYLIMKASKNLGLTLKDIFFLQVTDLKWLISRSNNLDTK